MLYLLPLNAEHVHESLFSKRIHGRDEQEGMRTTGSKALSAHPVCNSEGTANTTRLVRHRAIGVCSYVSPWIPRFQLAGGRDNTLSMLTGFGLEAASSCRLLLISGGNALQNLPSALLSGHVVPAHVLPSQQSHEL